MGKIEAVCISKEKGTVKTQVDECEIIEQYGLKNDAHAGSGRQVSLLSYEAVEAFKNGKGKDAVINPGIFGENLLVSGFDLAACKRHSGMKNGNSAAVLCDFVMYVCAESGEHYLCVVSGKSGLIDNGIAVCVKTCQHNAGLNLG